MPAPLKDRVTEWVVDQQLHSPLYTRLPLETRLLIFELSLAPFCQDPVVHDFRVRYNHADRQTDGALSETDESAQFTDGGSGEDTEDDDEFEIENEGGDESNADEEEDALPFLAWDLDDEDSDDELFEEDNTTPYSDYSPPARYWLRPDYVGIEKSSTTLLLTCRRVYIEARSCLFTPPFDLGVSSGAKSRFYDPWRSARTLYSRLTTEQRNSIVSARMFTGGRTSTIECLCRSQNLRRIEYLRLTANKPTDGTFALSDLFAFGGRVDNKYRTLDFGYGPPPEESPDAEWEPPVVWGDESWADVFLHMPRIKCLVIDFDAYEETWDRDKERVEWAVRVWRFPLWSPRSDGCTYLSAQGHPVRKMSWRGCADHFPPVCSRCSGTLDPNFMTPRCMCEYADEHLKLLERGLGPRIYTWTVKWTPRVGRPWVEPPGFWGRVREPADGRWKWEEGEDVGTVAGKCSLQQP
ncbi:uncharacterized protein B0H64DRAFT_57366 [Chaetomium fimeti]|uniref:Uncharacterized protein n=1 Tax=Chaetomium fimeti TaxID=1854472 RepID=A0AAE0LM81_9PEZI|nr:hypothetical protein B0H64DRAFT_57366 [Chaetomium fimeti]